MLLKSFASGGAGTKVIALGIGSGIDRSELADVASSPRHRTVILLSDFNNLNNLTSVEKRLQNESCTGMCMSFAIVMNYFSSVATKFFTDFKRFQYYVF